MAEISIFCARQKTTTCTVHLLIETEKAQVRFRRALALHGLLLKHLEAFQQYLGLRCILFPRCLGIESRQ